VEAAHVGAIKELSSSVQLAPDPDVDLQSWVLKKTWTYHHPSALARWALTPRRAVVRFDLPSARVSDCASWTRRSSPDIPSRTHHLPTIMIAERAAALIDCL
jgi:choline dehydrogenase-like flavoprotein